MNSSINYATFIDRPVKDTKKAKPKHNSYSTIKTDEKISQRNMNFTRLKDDEIENETA